MELHEAVLGNGIPMMPETPAEATVPWHGGDLTAIRARFADAPEPWIDLSTGISPWAYPIPDLAESVWSRLPEPAAVADLLETAGVAYGIPAGARAVPAPGTQALIQLLPRLRPAGMTAVVGPTYAEHAHCWKLAGHDVVSAPDLASAVSAAPAVVVVTNPNNPDGRIVPHAELMTALANLAGRGGWLVVDEAFADLMPGVSIAGAADSAGLIVLRSFGKSYGLAGLRLGMLLAAEPLAQAVAAALGPWAVSGPAVTVGRLALADGAWLDRTRRQAVAAASRLDGLLTGAGFTLLGGTPLFRLARSPAGAAAWVARLGRAGLHVRAFADFPDRLRFGLPGPEPHWHRLADVLAGAG